MKHLRHLLIIAVIFLGLWSYILLPKFQHLIQAGAQHQVFSTDSLAEYDGFNGNRAYFAYHGIVYDMTDTILWQEGEYFGLQAGQDWTTKIPLTDQVMDTFKELPVVGSYQNN